MCPISKRNFLSARARLLLRRNCARLFALTFVLAPHAVWADCVPATKTGAFVTVVVTTHSVNNLVSYTPATLFAGSSSTETEWSGNMNAQLFSDRLVPGAPGTFSTQPFNASAADTLGVTISDISGKITLTLTFVTWGNASVTAPASCDGPLLRASGVQYPNQGYTDVIVNFGTPQTNS